MSKEEQKKSKKISCDCKIELKNENSKEIENYKEKLNNIYSEYEKYNPDNFSSNWKKTIHYSVKNIDGTYALLLIFVILFVACALISNKVFESIKMDKEIIQIILSIVIYILLFKIKLGEEESRDIGDIIRIIDILEEKKLFNSNELTKLSLASLDIIEKQDSINKNFRILTIDSLINLIVLIISITFPFYIQTLSGDSLCLFIVYSVLASILLVSLLVIKNAIISFNSNSGKNKKNDFYRYIIEIQAIFKEAK